MKIVILGSIRIISSKNNVLALRELPDELNTISPSDGFMPLVVLPWFSHALLQDTRTKPGTGERKHISVQLGERGAPLNRQWPNIPEAAQQLRLHRALRTEIRQIIIICRDLARQPLLGGMWETPGQTPPRGAPSLPPSPQTSAGSGSPSSGFSLRCTAQPFKDKAFISLATGRIFSLLRQTVTGSAGAEAGEGRERQGEASFYAEKLLEKSQEQKMSVPMALEVLPEGETPPKEQQNLLFTQHLSVFPWGEAEALQGGCERWGSGWEDAVWSLHAGRGHPALPLHAR